jgi:hypothetical protein
VSTVIALPLDEVFEMTPMNTAIEDLFNLEFLITLN